MSEESMGQPQGTPPSKWYFLWALLGIALIVGVVLVVSGKPGSESSKTADTIFPEGTTATTVASDPAPVKFHQDKVDAKTPGKTANDTPAASTPVPAVKEVSDPKGPPSTAEIDAAKAAGTRRATIKTDKGDIVVELYGKDAPLTVANFVKLAKRNFYDGLTFHRVVEKFVIQGGDPSGDGTGGPGYNIDLEISPKLRHVNGALAMARSGDPNSAGSQFYITLGEQPNLDDQYAVFGKVVAGGEVPAKIRMGDRIKDIVLQ